MKVKGLKNYLVKERENYISNSATCVSKNLIGKLESNTGVIRQLGIQD
jgi:hypothetical protein